MVTPWRRWWRCGGDDGDLAKDLARSHQIRRDLARSGEISPDPVGSHKSGNQLLGTAKTQDRRWRLDFLGTAKTQDTVEIGPPRHGKNPRYGGDRRWRSETEKKMREGEGEGDGGREE
jgi:hypothetical protein